MHERQRVWRACQACRRKKVKCDGEHPCQSCSRNQVDCVYAESSSNTRPADAQYITRLENRIQLMEERLQQQLIANQTSCAQVEQRSSHLSTGVVPSSIEDLQGTQCTSPINQVGSTTSTTQWSPSESHDGNILEGLIPDTSGALLGSIADHATHNAESAIVDVTRLPEPLLQALIDRFYSSYYPIFPIIQKRDFQRQYDWWLSVRRSAANGCDVDDGNGFSFLFYALLAVAASAIPADHAVFAEPGLEAYKRVNVGDLLYSYATSKCPGLPYQRNRARSVNAAIAQGLLSLYLIEVGNVSSAWVIGGHAIRLYQSLELEALEDSADGAPDVGETWKPRGNVWWSLYILDCSLSTALSKPLAIDDAENDRGPYNEENHPTLGLEAKTDPWFSIIADFHITISRIYRSIRWIRKSYLSNDDTTWGTVRSSVRKYDTELEYYYTTQVLPKIEEPSKHGRRPALQTIAVSSYYIGVVLLYRTYIEQFNAANPEAFLRCAEAASNCIKVTPQVIATVPVSHFVVQQSRAVYASTKVLLRCMRLAQNASFNRKAWRDVETGFEVLCKINIKWPQIRKYQQLIEQDMQRTRIEFNRHELFHGLFDRYGQTAGARTARHPESPPAVHSIQDSHAEGSPNMCMDPSSHREQDGSKTNEQIRTPQTVIASKHSQYWQPFGQEGKRRKLSQNSVRHRPASAASSALNMFPIQIDPDSYAAVDQTMSTSDYFIPDLPPLPSSLEDSSTNLFEDTMLMSPIDQILS
ncbi:hypothetical protein PHISCL_04856 [Aspergillus sclerotialis]|uniref:Zn(2)-C6 fungal-type domain-containing protein n=1 Tax=Aspergillus sclerotialis TaxID=2070753 RepID=A0A3A2ZHU4_9EURO|nr:hypothetical protein PHISCL_04856 [Aspergillus sclerotialis]